MSERIVRYECRRCGGRLYLAKPGHYGYCYRCIEYLNSLRPLDRMAAELRDYQDDQRQLRRYTWQKGEHQ